MKSAIDQTPFKRSQMEWILEKSFENNKNHGNLKRDVLLNRIKRLLELDAKLDLGEGIAYYAFMSSNPAGNGDDRAFSLFDIFLVRLALEFVNAGFTQQDIVFLFRYTRNKIHKHFIKVLNYRDANGTFIKANMPDHVVGGKPIGKSDARSFIVTARGELREVNVPKLMKLNQPVFYEPIFVNGIEELGRFLDADTKINTHQFIIEYTRLAFVIQDSATKAPIIKRGRKAAPKLKGVKNEK